MKIESWPSPENLGFLLLDSQKNLAFYWLLLVFTQKSWARAISEFREFPKIKYRAPFFTLLLGWDGPHQPPASTNHRRDPAPASSTIIFLRDACPCTSIWNLISISITNNR
jgi:hypothetical protein